MYEVGAKAKATPVQRSLSPRRSRGGQCFPAMAAESPDRTMTTKIAAALVVAPARRRTDRNQQSRGGWYFDGGLGLLFLYFPPTTVAPAVAVAGADDLATSCTPNVERVEDGADFKQYDRTYVWPKKKATM